ncbi:hypothetical protein VTK26DRAFT_2715 [Humicola hyalothermophila]
MSRRSKLQQCHETKGGQDIHVSASPEGEGERESRAAGTTGAWLKVYREATKACCQILLWAKLMTHPQVWPLLQETLLMAQGAGREGPPRPTDPRCMATRFALSAERVAGRWSQAAKSVWNTRSIPGHQWPGRLGSGPSPIWSSRERNLSMTTDCTTKSGFSTTKRKSKRKAVHERELRQCNAAFRNNSASA